MYTGLCGCVGRDKRPDTPDMQREHAESNLIRIFESSTWFDDSKVRSMSESEIVGVGENTDEIEAELLELYSDSDSSNSSNDIAVLQKASSASVKGVLSEESLTSV